MSTIRELIQAAVDGEPVTASDAFDSIMSERIAGAIDSMVPVVAQQVFGDVSEEELEENIRRSYGGGSMFGTGGGYKDGGWTRPGLGHPARKDKEDDDKKKKKKPEKK